jgi:hypothetical protein
MALKESFFHRGQTGSAVRRAGVLLQPGRQHPGRASGGTVSWHYGDHLGSTSAGSGAASTSERYHVYNKDRGTGSLPTDHRFTGQISDASGMIFLNARNYAICLNHG